MVRENKESADGVDANKGVALEKELKEAGKWQGETIDPEYTMVSTPKDIRGDVEVEKKG